MFTITPLPAGEVENAGQGRMLSIRAYDGDALMTEAAVTRGEEFRERATDLLADPQVAFLHVHFAGPGCFAFRVDRA
jgi:hypothetical protein